MNKSKCTVNVHGAKQWHNSNHQLHRVDGPAVEWPSGTTEWWFNGKRHRIDGPAIETYDGHKEWWIYGKLHRLDGPAIEFVDEYKVWYINGKRIRAQFNNEILFYGRKNEN